MIDFKRDYARAEDLSERIESFLLLVIVWFKAGRMG